MSFFGFENIEPTIYDPKIHGIMTDEERYARNQAILDSVPPRDPDHMTDRFYYESYMSQGNEYGAAPFKAGYEADLAWEEMDRKSQKDQLVTKEELKKMKEYDRMMEKIDKEIDEKHGFNHKSVKKFLKSF